MNSDFKTAEALENGSLSAKEKLNAVYSAESSAIHPSLAQLQSDALKTSDEEKSYERTQSKH